MHSKTKELEEFFLDSVMPPKLKAMPTLKEIVVRRIVKLRSFFNQLYECENDLFEPVPMDIIDQIFDEYCSIPAPSLPTAALNVDGGLTANDICMLITRNTSKLNLSKLRAHRHNIEHSLICDALGTSHRVCCKLKSNES